MSQEQSELWDAKFYLPNLDYSVLLNCAFGVCLDLNGDGIAETSNVPNETNPENFDINKLRPLSQKELVKIILRRLAYKQNPAVNGNPIFSAAFGQPDFVPFPFLELGIRRGAAVCRIMWQFSSQGAQYFLDRLKLAKNNDKSFGLGEIAEVCAVSVAEASEIFGNITSSDQLKPEDFVVSDSNDRRHQINKIPIGTGFLVGRSFLLTNFHLFPVEADNLPNTLQLDQDLLTCFSAQFNYEQDVLGRDIDPIEYRIQKLIHADPKLDFALFELDAKPIDSQYSELGQAGDYFGWTPMLSDIAVVAPPLPKYKIDGESTSELTDEELRQVIEDAIKELPQDVLKNIKDLPDEPSSNDYLKMLKRKASQGEAVSIIQHPKGRKKEISLSENRVLALCEDRIIYRADADFSSSGSPVFNSQWQLVALHYGTIRDHTTGEVVAEVGIRISAIIQHLVNQIDVPRVKAAPNPQDVLANFLQQFARISDFSKIAQRPTESIPESYRKKWMDLKLNNDLLGQYPGL